MRIFYAVGDQPHGSLVGSKVWHYNLYMALRDLGHEVVMFRYDLEPHYAHADLVRPDHCQFNHEHRSKLEAELLRQVAGAHDEHHIDVFFSYFYSSFVRPEVIREIHRMGIVTVNWYCNASYQFHLIQALAPSYDFSLVPEKFRLDDYRRIGAHPIYCQEAANPGIYRPYPLQREFDVAFVGAEYGDRAQYIRHLVDKGIDARAWGPGWNSLRPPSDWRGRAYWWARRVKRSAIDGKRALRPVLPGRCCGDPLSDEEMVKMYSRAKISLGFSTVGSTGRDANPIKQVRLRDFEAPMSGAFYMVEYFDELADFFEPGKEIVFFYDQADLAEKALYYLNHEAEREAIRQAGHRRANAEHTWQIRLDTAFRQMGLGS